MIKSLILTVILLTALLISGCGGGGEGIVPAPQITSNDNSKSPAEDKAIGKKQAIALCAGINQFKLLPPKSWLKGCENDCNTITAIAVNNGFNTTSIKSFDVTKSRVIKEFNSAISTLNSGDIFLFNIISHGTRVKDTDGDESDGKDEAIVLTDSYLVDDEFFTILKKFKPGVRVLLIIDVCYSGGLNRGEDQEIMSDFLEKDKLTRGDEPEASIILLTACKDNESSYESYYEGKWQGMFIYTLRNIWDNGKFSGNYKAFLDKIAITKPAKRSKPQYFFIGKPMKEFEDNKPFKV